MCHRELAFQLADQFRALGAGITLKVRLFSHPCLIICDPEIRCVTSVRCVLFAPDTIARRWLSLSMSMAHVCDASGSTDG